MTGSGNWTYLLPGPGPVLIDAGVGHAAHLDAIVASVPAGPATVAGHARPSRSRVRRSGAGRARPATRFVKCPWPERDAHLRRAWTPLADGQIVDTPDGPLHGGAHVRDTRPTTSSSGTQASAHGVHRRPAGAGQHGGDPGLARRCRSATTSPRSRGSPRCSRRAPCRHTARSSTIRSPSSTTTSPIAGAVRRRCSRRCRRATSTSASIAARIYRGLDPALRAAGARERAGASAEARGRRRVWREGDAWRRR